MTSSEPDLPEIVRTGQQVILEMTDQDGRRERMTLDVVPDTAADFAAGFLGSGTPLACAIMGRPVGSVVPYRMADIVEVHILAIAPSPRVPAEDAAAGRDAATQEAVSRSNLEESVRLALTVDVKWGEYDPESLEPPADSSDQADSRNP